MLPLGGVTMFGDLALNPIACSIDLSFPFFSFRSCRPWVYGFARQVVSIGGSPCDIILFSFSF